MGKQDYQREFEEKWAGKANDYVGNSEKMGGLADTAGKFVKIRGLARVAEDLKLLIHYVKDIATRKYTDYSRASLSLVIGVLIYVVSPVDIIPDFIPGLGWTDDATLIAWAIKELDDELQRYKRRRIANKR